MDIGVNTTQSQIRYLIATLLIFALIICNSTGESTKKNIPDVQTDDPDIIERIKDRIFSLVRGWGYPHVKPGDRAFRSGNYPKAARHYEQAIEEGLFEPYRSWCHLQLGKAYHETGDREKAIQQYKRAVAFPIKASYLHECYYNLGLAYSQIGAFDNAISAYEKTLQFKPDFAQAHLTMGLVFEIEGRLDEAIVAFQNAINIDSNNAAAHYNLGRVYHKQGKLDATMAAYEMAIRITPDSAGAYNNLGLVLKDKDKLSEAVGAFKMAVGIKPNYVSARQNLAFALTLRGELEAAAAQLKAILKQQPQNESTNQQLQMIHLQLERDEPLLIKKASVIQRREQEGSKEATAPFLKWETYSISRGDGTQRIEGFVTWSGRTSTAGKPAIGLPITVFQVTPQQRKPQLMGQAITNSHGKFSLRVPLGSDFTFLAKLHQAQNVPSDVISELAKRKAENSDENE